MFTLNIRKITAGKTGMKWNQDWRDISRWVKYDSDLYLHEMKKRHDSNDHAWVQQYIDRMAKESATEKAELIKSIDEASKKAPRDQKEKYAQFKTDYESRLQKATEAYTKNQDKIQFDAMNKRAWLKTNVEDKDNNARQAEAFIESLKLLASTDPTATILLNRFTAGSGNDGDAYVNLSSMNVASMIKWMARGMPMSTNGLTPVGYTSNGMDNGETKGLQKIAETLGTSWDKDKIMNLSKKIASFYDAGQTTEDFLLAVHNSQDTTPYNKDTFVASLSDYRASTTYTLDANGRVDSKDRSFFTPYAPGELSTYFKWLSEGDLLSRLNTVLKIGGVASTATTLAGLADTMKRDPATRAAYIKWLNIVAFSNDRSAFFRTGKFEAGLNTDTSKKLIENMQSTEMQSAVKSALDANATATKDAVAKDPKITDAQKESITAKIDRVIAELSTPDRLTALSIESAMAVTNRRIGGGISVGTELHSTLADSVALTGSLSKEFGWKIGSLIALSFTKEIFASESAELGVHYGVSYASKFVPFLGVHGRYEDILAAITMSPVGANVYAGIRLGTNRDQDARLQKEVGKSAEAITRLVKDIQSIDAIDLKWIVTNTDIAESMTKNLKVFLTENKYDPASPDLIKETVMKSSIMEAMNIELLSLYRQKNDMGWVLDQAWVNFGQLAGLAYILPGFRIARTDMITGITKHTSTQQVGEIITPIDKATLFGTPAMVDGTTEYSVEFKNDKINKWAIALPPGAAWDTSADHKPTTISGLKDYGLKVTLQDGKYKVEYDTTKKIVVWESQKGNDAIKVENVEIESLARIDSISKALSNPQFRKALSHLWNNPTRKPQANTFANMLQNIGDSGSIAEARDAFVKLVTKPVLIREFSWIVQVLAKMTDAKLLQSALFDIRWGMMMDENQANTVSRSKDGSLLVTEKIKNTQKRFDGMINNSKMRSLFEQIGISAADYAGMVVWSGDKITLGAPKPGIMGAIASLKTGTPYMARMPAGTVRFAQSGDQEFAKDISVSASSDQKSKMFDTILSPTSLDALSLRTNIAKILWTQIEQVTFDNLKDLMVMGIATINERIIKMEWQKFWLCAYGDCTNPGITMQAGSISTPEIPGKKVVSSVDISAREIVVRIETVDNYTTAFGTRHTGVNIGVWYEGRDPQTNVPTTTETNYRTEIQTRDVQVWPNNIQTINGNRVIVVNTGGTQTNIPLSSLTRPQAIALSGWQSVTLNVSVNIQVPTTTVTTWAAISRAPEAVALVGTITATEISTLLGRLLADSEHKFAGDLPK